SSRRDNPRSLVAAIEVTRRPRRSAWTASSWASSSSWRYRTSSCTRLGDGGNTFHRASRRSGGRGGAPRRNRRGEGHPRTRMNPPRTRGVAAGSRLKKSRLNLESVAADLPEDLVLLQDLLHVERRDRRLDFLRPTAPSERAHARVDEPEHVQLRDQVRHAPLSERRHARLPRQV